ncbi:MAG: hypothetical protein V1930_09825 [Pseudomonadota bacterium]
MFWRKEKGEKNSPEGNLQEKGSGAVRPQKEKVGSPKEQMKKRIEDLTSGNSLIWKLPKIYWSGLGYFAIIELNDQYPKKGRKYTVSTDAMVEEKPAGQKIFRWDSNSPKDLIKWVIDKEGILMN